MDDNGTYLGNIYIYGIYKECIANISIDIYDIKSSDTQTPFRDLENVYVYRSWLCLGISLDLYTLRFPCVFAVRV